MKNIKTIAIALILSLVATSAFAANVNKDVAATIASDLKGVGTVKAEAIVAERETNGDFADGADLVARVKGIGPMTIEKNVDMLKFNGKAKKDKK